MALRRTSIDEFLSLLAPDLWVGDARENHPLWPPDLFAIVASLLDESGSYIRAVDPNYPPEFDETGTPWHVAIQQLARHWRREWNAWLEPEDRPNLKIGTVQGWWAHLLEKRLTPVDAIVNDTDLCHALLQMLAVSDEACFGIGTDYEPLREIEEPVDNLVDVDDADDEGPDNFWLWANRLLMNDLETSGSTLCEQIHPHQARVLPKLKTPGVGMTLRSVSLYLALCRSRQVRVNWYCPAGSGWKPVVERYINLMLVPWPKTITPSSFREAKALSALPYSLFRFDPADDPDAPPPGRQIDRLWEAATAAVSKIDGVVLPELAVDLDTYHEIWQTVQKRNGLLIAGLRESQPDALCRNYAKITFLAGNTAVSYEQEKHHRWRLDRNQIVNYGLASQLHPDELWWEGIALSSRQLSFLSWQPWITACVLICEDLARQDPIANIIRAVGPNLVIALLMDGPQLERRWSSRYATVFADDPGSSVLTLSSIGMVERSRPPTNQQPSRVVALWKDAINGVVEITLPPGHDAIVLSLVNVEDLQSHHDFEQAADGRLDEVTNSTLILGGIHPIPHSHPDPSNTT